MQQTAIQPGQAQGLTLQESVYTPFMHQVPLGGIAPDLTIHFRADKGYVASALNFVIRNGGVRKREGYTTTLGTTTATSATRNYYEWVPYDGSARLIAVNSTSHFYYDSASTTWVAISSSALAGSLLSSVPTDPVIFASMRTATSGLRLITTNNAKNPPMWWSGDTASTFTVLTTAVIGTCCATWRSHFLQGDTTDTADGHVACRIHWSSLGDPTVWSGTASAGSIDLLDINASRVMNILPMQKQLLVYKEEGVHVLTYKASPFYFTQALLHPSVTLLAKSAVCSVQGGDYHFVFTKDGAILWDGQTVRSIGRDRVDRTILAALTPSSYETVQAVWWPFTNEVLLIVSNAVATQQLWVYNVEYDSWWQTDVALLTALPLYRSITGGIVIGSTQTSNSHWSMFKPQSFVDGTASAAVSATMRLGLYNYGTEENKEIDRLTVYANLVANTGTQQLNFYINGHANPSNPGYPFSADANSGSLSITTDASVLPHGDIRVTGRYLEYVLQHTGTTDLVDIHSIVPRVTKRSDKRVSRV